MTTPLSPHPRDAATAHPWITVAEAADRSGIGTSTIRHWYRTGRVPTQRADGGRGAFLVPLDVVLAVAARTGTCGGAPANPATDGGVAAWEARIEAARAEAAAGRAEAADLATRLQASEGELDVTRRRLRKTTAELTDARRILVRTEAELAEARHELARTDAELQKLREISSIVGSITDTSWIDLPTNSYRSPVRPQSVATADASAGALLVATPPEEAAPSPSPPAARPFVPSLGHHDDDLLPKHEQRGLRGRR